MRRDELEHLLRAAGAVLGETDLIVVGSQALLGRTIAHPLQWRSAPAGSFDPEVSRPGSQGPPAVSSDRTAPLAASSRSSVAHLARDRGIVVLDFGGCSEVGEAFGRHRATPSVQRVGAPKARQYIPPGSRHPEASRVRGRAMSHAVFARIEVAAAAGAEFDYPPTVWTRQLG